MKIFHWKSSLFRPCKKFSGIFYLLLGNFIFTSYTFAFKTIEVDIAKTLLVRQFVQASIFGIFAKFYKNYKLSQDNGRKLAAFLSVLTSSTANMTYTLALYFLPLSDLNLIKHTYVIWTAIFSVIFLRQNLSWKTMLSALSAMIGLTITTRPDLFVSDSINFGRVIFNL